MQRCAFERRSARRKISIRFKYMPSSISTRFTTKVYILKYALIIENGFWAAITDSLIFNTLVSTLSALFLLHFSSSDSLAENLKKGICFNACESPSLGQM